MLNVVPVSWSKTYSGRHEIECRSPKWMCPWRRIIGFRTQFVSDYRILSDIYAFFNVSNLTEFCFLLIVIRLPHSTVSLRNMPPVVNFSRTLKIRRNPNWGSYHLDPLSDSSYRLLNIFTPEASFTGWSPTLLYDLY